MPNHNIQEKIENGGASHLGKLTAAETNIVLQLLNQMPLPLTGLTRAQLRLTDLVYEAGRIIIEADTMTRKVGDGIRSYQQLPDLAVGGASRPTATILATYRTAAPWTPVVADAPSEGNVATYTAADGSWMQVGDMVHVSCRLIGINKTPLTAGNPLYIHGLPAQARPGTLNCFTSSIRTEFVTYSGALTPFMDDGDGHILLYQNVSGAASTPLPCSALAAASGSSMRFSMSFITE